jgi:hypothetical protein
MYRLLIEWVIAVTIAVTDTEKLSRIAAEFLALRRNGAQELPNLLIRARRTTMT